MTGEVEDGPTAEGARGVAGDCGLNADRGCSSAGFAGGRELPGCRGGGHPRSVPLGGDWQRPQVLPGESDGWAKFGLRFEASCCLEECDPGGGDGCNSLPRLLRWVSEEGSGSNRKDASAGDGLSSCAFAKQPKLVCVCVRSASCRLAALPPTFPSGAARAKFRMPLKTNCFWYFRLRLLGFVFCVGLGTPKGLSSSHSTRCHLFVLMRMPPPQQQLLLLLLRDAAPAAAPSPPPSHSPLLLLFPLC